MEDKKQTYIKAVTYITCIYLPDKGGKKTNGFSSYEFDCFLL